jgi:hypothetical protein
MTWDDLVTWAAWPDWYGPAEPVSVAGQLVSTLVVDPFREG